MVTRRRDVSRTARLVAVTDAVRLAALSRLAAARRIRDSVHREMANLDAGGPPAGDGLDAAALCGARERWQRWREKETARLARKLAEAERAVSAARADAARAAGRDRAAGGLLDRARAARRHDRNRQ